MRSHVGLEIVASFILLARLLPAAIPVETLASGKAKNLILASASRPWPLLGRQSIGNDPMVRPEQQQVSRNQPQLAFDKARIVAAQHCAQPPLQTS
jgi:hypothetical protein